VNSSPKITWSHLDRAALIYLLTELPEEFPLFRRHVRVDAATVPLVIRWEEEPRDLTALVVRLVGSVIETGDPWQPYRLLDSAGVAVDPVAGYLRDLQAIGRPASTQVLRTGVAAVVPVLVDGGDQVGSGHSG
jgi:hypothetical protein